MQTNNDGEKRNRNLTISNQVPYRCDNHMSKCTCWETIWLTVGHLATILLRFIVLNEIIL